MTVCIECTKVIQNGSTCNFIEDLDGSKILFHPECYREFMKKLKKRLQP